MTIYESFTVSAQGLWAIVYGFQQTSWYMFFRKTPQLTETHSFDLVSHYLYLVGLTMYGNTIKQ